jgi:predicted PhzF superfamily epimerase YddE/YHI9
MKLPFFQVDAFADRPFAGNPAAVIPLEAWLDDDVMQAIAEENNLSETAFTVPAAGDADYELRWFTPTTEVALCGHATDGKRACSHSRRRRRPVPHPQGREPRGAARRRSPVARPSGHQGAGRAHGALLDALGTPGATVFNSYSGAEATSIVLLDSAEAVRACTPDMRALRDIELMVIVTAPGDGEQDVVSRVFVPAWGWMRTLSPAPPMPRWRHSGRNGWDAPASPPIRRAGAAASSIAAFPATGRSCPAAASP